MLHVPVDGAPRRFPRLDRPRARFTILGVDLTLSSAVGMEPCGLREGDGQTFPDPVTEVLPTTGNRRDW
jgi:hypothetical protein